jgi:hypothetical protein
MAPPAALLGRRLQSHRANHTIIVAASIVLVVGAYLFASRRK